MEVMPATEGASPPPDAAALRRVLLALAAERTGRTYCPSEAARRLAPDWRPLMPHVRESAAALLQEGLLTCTQRSQPAHPLHTRGAIRLSAPSTPHSST